MQHRIEARTTGTEVLRVYIESNSARMWAVALPRERLSTQISSFLAA